MSVEQDPIIQKILESPERVAKVYRFVYIAQLISIVMITIGTIIFAMWVVKNL